jgi:branched-chain amino acid transport system permease protein
MSEATTFAGPPRRSVSPALVFGAAAVVFTAVLPVMPFANDYVLALAVRILLFVALGQSWNIIAGVGGQLSLGHGIFFGIGAYATAILFNSFGVTPWIGVWLAAALAAILAFVIGLATFHLRGIYFALATVVISLGIEKLARFYVDLTGGDSGLAIVFRGDAPAAMQWREPAPFLWMALAVVTLYYVVTRVVLASRFGLALQSVRDDETAAASSGVDVRRTKMLGLLLSAAMTSAAGTLYVQFYLAIDPHTAFGLFQAIQIQLPALIGGIGTAGGPIVGGVLMIMSGELTNIFGTWVGVTGIDVFIYGLLLLVVVLRAPKGLLRSIARGGPARRAPA